MPQRLTTVRERVLLPVIDPAPGPGNPYWSTTVFALDRLPRQGWVRDFRIFRSNTTDALVFTATLYAIDPSSAIVSLTNSLTTTQKLLAPETLFTKQFTINAGASAHAIEVFEPPLRYANQDNPPANKLYLSIAPTSEKVTFDEDYILYIAMNIDSDSPG